MARRDKNTGKKFALGAIVAAVAGYVTGVLTAPQSGKDTRDDLVDKAEDAKYTAEDQLQSANEELKQVLKDAKTKSVALSAKAREEFDEAVVKAKDASNKAVTVLKSVKAGEAEDPELNKAIKQAKQAAKNLGRFLKS